jgi:hypothetical protein
MHSTVFPEQVRHFLARPSPRDARLPFATRASPLSLGPFDGASWSAIVMPRNKMPDGDQMGKKPGFSNGQSK